MSDFLATALEVKAFGDEAAGEFSGYGAVYLNTDLIGDRLMPGCFAAALAERKSLKRPLPMHYNHGLAMLGGERAVGVWTKIEDRAEGLYLEGKISGMSTDRGRMYYERLKDGAVSGLSIGFNVKASTPRRAASDPRRTITDATLAEVSIVDDPCNPAARVLAVKSMVGQVVPELEEFKAALDAGELPSQRAFERLLRDALGFSRAQAATVAGRGYKSLCSREREGEARSAAAQRAIADLGDALSGFSLPKF